MHCELNLINMIPKYGIDIDSPISLSACRVARVLNMRVMSIYLALLSPSAMLTFQSRRTPDAGEIARGRQGQSG